MLACEGCSSRDDAVRGLKCRHGLCHKCMAAQGGYLPKVHKDGVFVCMACGRRHKISAYFEEDKADTSSLSNQTISSGHGHHHMFSVEINQYLKHSARSIDLFEDENHRTAVQGHLGRTVSQEPKQLQRNQDTHLHANKQIFLCVNSKNDLSRFSIPEVSEGQASFRSHIGLGLHTVTKEKADSLSRHLPEPLLHPKWHIPVLCPAQMGLFLKESHAIHRSNKAKPSKSANNEARKNRLAEAYRPSHGRVATPKQLSAPKERLTTPSKSSTDSPMRIERQRHLPFSSLDKAALQLNEIHDVNQLADTPISAEHSNIFWESMVLSGTHEPMAHSDVPTLKKLPFEADKASNTRIHTHNTDFDHGCTSLFELIESAKMQKKPYASTQNPSKDSLRKILDSPAKKRPPYIEASASSSLKESIVNGYAVNDHMLDISSKQVAQKRFSKNSPIKSRAESKQASCYVPSSSSKPLPNSYLKPGPEASEKDRKCEHKTLSEIKQELGICAEKRWSADFRANQGRTTTYNVSGLAASKPPAEIVSNKSKASHLTSSQAKRAKAMLRTSDKDPIPDSHTSKNLALTSFAFHDPLAIRGRSQDTTPVSRYSSNVRNLRDKKVVSSTPYHANRSYNIPRLSGNVCYT